MTGELEPEEENLPRGSFEMGVAYEMTQDGRLGRAPRALGGTSGGGPPEAAAEEKNGSKKNPIARCRKK